MLAKEKDIDIVSKCVISFSFCRSGSDKFCIQEHSLERNKIHTEKGSITVNVSGANAGGKIHRQDLILGYRCWNESVAVEKLFRIDSISTTRGTDGEHGTGLGLILCKDYIELNQGKITVDSRLNSGLLLQFIVLARLSHKLRCPPLCYQTRVLGSCCLNRLSRRYLKLRCLQ